ncbi:DNA-binding transcriptional regulator, XRE family [Anaerobium acetethylicum]|uniref:DNA-binding transcriptional regulator, XRE family n=2 Tax=Anaerobium acetethylicum TaxID=1619234 RepID=A0A1D3TYJ3_9FIRM|nr:DNA-binding transcriptional regulator, XRE family [Anaerobium acetethylicum]
MISYAPFWATLKEKNISTYQLVTEYHISRSLIDKLKHDKGLTTSTLNELCKILHCQLNGIAEYIEDKE